MTNYSVVINEKLPRTYEYNGIYCGHYENYEEASNCFIGKILQYVYGDPYIFIESAIAIEITLSGKKEGEIQSFTKYLKK